VLAAAVVGIAQAAAAFSFAAVVHADGAGSGVAIRGRVDIDRRAQPTGRRPSPAALGQATPEHAEVRPAVVFLESAPHGAFEREESRARMDQRGEAFVPHVLAVTVGTTVDFPNSDPVFHNVFSLSKTRPFDLGRYPAGKSKSVKFERPGIVQVFCEIHSHMSAYILVFAHRYFDVTAEDGRFALAEVPPGTYTVSVWYEGAVRASRTVAVGAAADVTGVDFTVR
jgi:plastocyanin